VVAESALDEGDWEAKLRAQAWRNHNMWRAHPGIVRVYAEGVTMGPNGVANVEHALGILRQAGFSDEESGAAFMLLYRWSMATLLVGRTRPVSRHVEPPPVPRTKEDRLRAYFSALPIEEIPNIEATVVHMSGSSIEFGLDIIISGLKERLNNNARARAEAAINGAPEGDT
jgi:TetR/AcrR family tetracycline transcriptional repressor